MAGPGFAGRPGCPAAAAALVRTRSRAGFCCAELPAKAEKGAGTRLIRMIEPKVLDPDREPYPVGSPVCHDGLVYAVRSGWGSGKSRKLQEEVRDAWKSVGVEAKRLPHILNVCCLRESAVPGFI